MTRVYFIQTLCFLLPLLLPSRSLEEDAGPPLWIETPQKPPYLVNSSVVFSCIHKLKDRYEKLSWEFILLSNNSTLPALIDSSFEDTSVGFNRTSSIRIPTQAVSAISCVWSNLNGSKTSASLPVQVTGLPPRVSKRQAENNSYEDDECVLKGPQIFFASVAASSSNHSCDHNNNYNFDRMTGGRLRVSPSIAPRFILACVYFGNQTIAPSWSLASRGMKSKTLVLNYLALINWKRIRLQPKICLQDSDNDLMRKLLPARRNCPISEPSGSLEVIVAPESSPVTSVFKCSSPTTREESQITVVTEPEMDLKEIFPTNAKDDNREFLELISALMQILQASESSGGGSGGNGGIYGVGFGSSTIIVLMAIAIYYLKRQIKQLQEQVELGERRRRKSRPSKAQVEEDDEDDEL